MNCVRDTSRWQKREERQGAVYFLTCAKTCICICVHVHVCVCALKWGLFGGGKNQ